MFLYIEPCIILMCSLFILALPQDITSDIHKTLLSNLKSACGYVKRIVCSQYILTNREEVY